MDAGRSQEQTAAITLREAEKRFVETWGQMAGAWGISRTMAEIHAILYLSSKPLSMDDLMIRLDISRGNASMSLRSLLDWGIVSRVHKRGDRKEYFQAEQDVWAMFRAIVRERVKREAEPLAAQLHEIRDLTRRSAKSARAATEAEKQELAEVNKKLESMINFFQMLQLLSERFVSPAGRGLQEAATLLGKVKSLGRDL